MKKITKKILYFISGPAPSGQQIKQAMELGASFRNAALIGENESLENAMPFAVRYQSNTRVFQLLIFRRSLSLRS